jgi:hypothetical protein
MRAYVAGPMTGLPDFNYPAFHAAAAQLRALGAATINPAENPVPPCGSWRGYMKLAVAQVAQCDVLVLLQGWESSKGARVEFQLACGLGMLVLPLDQALSFFAAPRSPNCPSMIEAASPKTAESALPEVSVGLVPHHHPV